MLPLSVQAAMTDYPLIKLQSLDKLTARTTTFEAKVGTTIKFGPLFIRVQACRKSDPIDKPESAAFLQIWEVPPESETSEWIFSGWMYASSPAISAMDHPVYDVWVIDCLSKEQPNQAAIEGESEAQAAQQEIQEKSDSTKKAEKSEEQNTQIENPETGIDSLEDDLQDMLEE